MILHDAVLTYGAEAVSDVDALTLLLSPGFRGSAAALAHTILERCERYLRENGMIQTPLSWLMSAPPAEIRRLIPELSPQRIAQIKAGLHLGVRAIAPHPDEVSLHNPQAVYRLLAPRLAHLPQEEFWVLTVNAKSRLLGTYMVTRGTLSASVIHPREIFHVAVAQRAHSILLAHNHPSGDPTPSKEDIDVTKRLVRVGNVLGIPVLDHIIIGRDRFTSLYVEGVIPHQR